ncbi:glycosyltransferase family 2 protein [Cellulomonas fimi]|uniref:Glycosyltransferase family 2 protein n=2 Tax=Cellulomonas fimi TaxID=1708 RepID=A0A7Y0M2S6_CELFI|nr:glycosyltransferase family 2 protein [Cellulomonas fimi]
MGGDPERVAVVVVTFNSVDVVPGLLASLPAGMGSLSWTLVVVDNGSSDDTVDVVRSIAPYATVIRSDTNGGYAAGINLGVAHAGDCTAVLVLNPDVRLERDCVPELVTALGRTGAGIVVPRLDDAHGRLLWSRRREPTLRRALADTVLGAERAGRIADLGEVITDPGAYGDELPTDWAEGSTQLISAQCWAAVGPWDESYFLYSEETDFALRARDAGYATYFVPTARAVHLQGGSARNPALWQLLVVNRLRLFSRRHGTVATACFWAVLVARETSRATLGKRTSRAALRALTSPRYLRQVAGPHSIAPSTAATRPARER